MRNRSKVALFWGFTALMTNIGVAQAQTTWLPGTPTGTLPYFVEKFVGSPGANLAQCGSGAAYPILYGSQGAEAGTCRCPDPYGHGRSCRRLLSAVWDLRPDGGGQRPRHQGRLPRRFVAVPASGPPHDSRHLELQLELEYLVVELSHRHRQPWRAFGTQTFSLEGRSDVSLDIAFVDEGNNGQCLTPGSYSVVQGRPVTLTIDTDNDSGGCLQHFGSASNTDGDGDGVSD